MHDRAARIQTLTAASEARTSAKRVAVQAAIESLIKKRRPVNVHAVAAEAGVSRTFIYKQSDLLASIKEAQDSAAHRCVTPQRSATEESLRKRLATALDALEQARATINEQERRIERLTGEVARLMASH